jgi:hypothetical protein
LRGFSFFVPIRHGKQTLDGIGDYVRHGFGPHIFCKCEHKAAIIDTAALLWWVLGRYVDNAVRDDRQASAVAAHEADARANDAAGMAAAARASAIAQENQDARSLAAFSDDPLADGLTAFLFNYDAYPDARK